MKSIYLERYAWPENILTDYSAFADVAHIVVIPAHNEPNLPEALNALNKCTPPSQDVLVIVVVNEPEDATAEVQMSNELAYTQVKALDTWFHLEVVLLRLPKKKAGVGLARKIGMDEAIRIFHAHNKEGLILCFDADCTCDSNFFCAVQEFYLNPSANLGLLYYEHPLDNQYPQEITNYELFLRYYINALRYAVYPHAVQTLGSCITVRSSAYKKQGGMNTRKAGEDFYFIHKMVPLGGIGEINNTCIYPSDRISDRVPFGTGHAISKYLSLSAQEYQTYNPQIFQDLKGVFSLVPKIYEQQSFLKLGLPESCFSFYEELSFQNDLAKILKQSNSTDNFNKRFFAWWDGFKVLKYVHFCRDHYYPNVPLAEGSSWLIHNHFHKDNPSMSTKEKLLFLRSKDREVNFYIK